EAPYALPSPPHWEKYAEAWFNSNYQTYFINSTIVTAISVALLSILGAMAAYGLARFRFPGNRLIFFLLFSTIILPPQMVMIGIFQLLVGYKLYDTHTGLILVYVAMQLPLTIYILESFFSRL